MKIQFRQLFERSPDAMLIVDRAGKITEANAQAECLFGYARNQLRGELVQTVFPCQAPIPYQGTASQEDLVGRHMELVGRRSCLSQFPADVTVIPLQTDQGGAIVMTIRDITEAQRAQFVLELGLDLLESADRDRQALLGHLIRAQEEERRRIAADVHDDTIQMLTAASLRLHQLRRRLQDPDKLQILDKLGETLSLSLGRLRQLIFDLRPASLDDGSPARALRAILEEMRAQSGIAYRLEDGCSARVPASSAALIYRTAQEALVNVRKHAQATTVRVKVHDVSGGCLTQITDDGVGYSPAEVEGRPGHLGLTLMRERAQIAGGWCRIESAPGGGTTVEFWVPLDVPPDQPKADHERAA
jgi:PAS domain S-box-containing protein